MAYATLEQLSQRMGGVTLSGDAAARFADALEDASGMINADTGRNFAARSGVAKTFAVQHQNAHTLRLPDFTALTSLKVDESDTGVFDVEIEASGYELTAKRDEDGWPFDCVRLLDRDFPTGGRRTLRIQVTANWGWAEVPVEINRACTLLAARLGGREGSSPTGLQSFGGEGGAYIRTNDPDYRHSIRNYIRPMVAG
jgi:hypothetical protein